MTITRISDKPSMLLKVACSVLPSMDPFELTSAAAHCGDIIRATPAVFVP